jgi:hypothetical protein
MSPIREVKAVAEPLASEQATNEPTPISGGPELQGKNGATAGSVANPYPAAMRTRDLGNDGEAETGAGVAFARTAPEALEQMAPVVRRHARSAVRHTDRAIGTDRDGYFRIGRRVADRILDEVA